jgi:hypothetical protein
MNNNSHTLYKNECPGWGYVTSFRVHGDLVTIVKSDADGCISGKRTTTRDEARKVYRQLLSEGWKQ